MILADRPGRPLGPRAEEERDLPERCAPSSPACARSGSRGRESRRRSRCPPRCPGTTRRAPRRRARPARARSAGGRENSTTITGLRSVRARSNTASANCALARRAGADARGSPPPRSWRPPRPGTSSTASACGAELERARPCRREHPRPRCRRPARRRPAPRRAPRASPATTVTWSSGARGAPPGAAHLAAASANGPSTAQPRIAAEQRQHVALVLQHDQRARRHRAGEAPAGRERLGALGGATAPIRIVEQPQPAT